jgi:hypothetical protein
LKAVIREESDIMNAEIHLNLKIIKDKIEEECYTIKLIKQQIVFTLKISKFSYPENFLERTRRMKIYFIWTS